MEAAHWKYSNVKQWKWTSALVTSNKSVACSQRLNLWAGDISRKGALHRTCLLLLQEPNACIKKVIYGMLHNQSQNMIRKTLIGKTHKMGHDLVRFSWYWQLVRLTFWDYELRHYYWSFTKKRSATCKSL